MVRPPSGLFERKYRKKPQIVQSIDGMGDSEDFLLNKVGEGGSNILLFSQGIDWYDSIFWLKFVR